MKRRNLFIFHDLFMVILFSKIFPDRLHTLLLLYFKRTSLVAVSAGDAVRSCFFKPIDFRLIFQL